MSLVFIFAIVTALAAALPPLLRRARSIAELRNLVLSEERFHFWLAVAILVSLIIGAVGHDRPAPDRDQGVPEDGVLSRGKRRRRSKRSITPNPRPPPAFP